MSSLDQLLAALRKRVGFEAVTQNQTPNQLRLLGRIPADALGLNGNNWKIIKRLLLKAMKERPWTVDISKSYFIQEETDKLVYAWRILFQGENIAQHYADITNLIATAPSAQAEVMEIPYGGVDANRNSTAGGRRGAGPAGTVPVGPMAVQQKLMGG